MYANITLTPVSGTLLLLIMILAGRAFRQNWKAQTQGWVLRAWIYGLPAAVSFLMLALLPLTVQ
jgi:hypothetical protein